MNAEQFVNQTFGAASPVGDPYLGKLPQHGRRLERAVWQRTR